MPETGGNTENMLIVNSNKKSEKPQSSLDVSQYTKNIVPQKINKPNQKTDGIPETMRKPVAPEKQYAHPFLKLLDQVKNGDPKEKKHIIDAQMKQDPKFMDSALAQYSFKQIEKKREKNPQSLTADDIWTVQIYGYVKLDKKIVLDGKDGKQTQSILLFFQEKAEVARPSEDRLPLPVTKEQKSQLKEYKKSEETYNKKNDIPQQYVWKEEHKLSDVKQNPSCADFIQKDNPSIKNPLQEDLVRKLLDPKSLEKKTPQQIAEMVANKSERMFMRLKSTVLKSCVKYVQSLFSQQITSGGQMENLLKVLENADPSKDVNISSDNTMTITGQIGKEKIAVNYNLDRGDISYIPYLHKESATQNITMGNQKKSEVIIKNAPTIHSLFDKATSSLEKKASDGVASRVEVRDAFDEVQEPNPQEIQSNQKLLAKAIEGEYLVRQADQLFGYQVKDLSYQQQGNTPLYKLYEMIRNTVNYKGYTAQDLYQLRTQLQTYENILQEDFLAGQPKTKDIFRKGYFNQARLQREQKFPLSSGDELAHKLFFSQLVDNATDTTKENYQVLQIKDGPNSFKNMLDQYTHTKTFPSYKIQQANEHLDEKLYDDMFKKASI